jgi:hypothetical protein
MWLGICRTPRKEGESMIIRRKQVEHYFGLCEEAGIVDNKYRLQVNRPGDGVIRYSWRTPAGAILEAFGSREAYMMLTAMLRVPECLVVFKDPYAHLGELTADDVRNSAKFASHHNLDRCEYILRAVADAMEKRDALCNR